MPDTGPSMDAILKDPQALGRILISPAGSLNAAELIRLIGGNFQSGALLSHQWNEVADNGGTAAAVSGELVLSTNTTANGRIRVDTMNRARFITATFNIAHQAIQLPNVANTDVIRRWGMFDPASPIISGDGVFWECNEGSYRLMNRKAGVDTEIANESNFNAESLTGYPNAFVKNSSIHIYEIIYNAGTVLFLQDRNLIHRFGAPNSALAETSHFRAGMDCENINGNTVNNTILTRGFGCSRIGSKTANPDKFRISASGTGIIKTSPGTLRRMILTDVGVGGAALTLYDNTTATGLVINTYDLTDTPLDLELGFDFNFGLSYSVSGSGFDLMVVYD